MTVADPWTEVCRTEPRGNVGMRCRNPLSDWLKYNAGARGYQPDPSDSIDFEQTVEVVVLEGF